jgi:hypothetical protein
MALIIRLIEKWDEMFKEAQAAGAVKVGNE